MSVELIGREAELSAIRVFLAGPTPAVLLLDGEAGIGKTSLWRAAIAQDHAGAVLIARPTAAEAELSFAARSDLRADVLDETLSALPAPQRRGLEAALLIADADGETPDQRTIGAALLNVLRALAARRPIVVAIDDVQWLDPASHAALVFCVRRLRDEAVRLLLTARTTGVDEQADELAVAMAEERLERRTIGPLTVGAVRSLLQTRLGASFQRPVLRRLYETSGGNPFLAIEIARELAHVDEELRPGEPLPVPFSLRQLLEARIARLSEAARRTLVAASAAGKLNAPTLVTVVGADALEGVDEALEADILVREGEHLRFSHPLLRSTVYDLASLPERRLAHRRLADSAVDAEERARHLALATDSPNAATDTALDAGAAAALARGAFATAGEIAEQAARLTPPDERDRLWRRRMTASKAHHTAGNFAAARVMGEAALADASPGEQRALSLFGLGALEDAEGEPAVAAAKYRLALAEPGVSDRYRAEIATSLAYKVAMSEPIDEAAVVAREALALAERCGDAGPLSTALARVALFETFRGANADGLMQRALELEREQIAANEQPAWARRASVHFAEQLGLLGEFAAARSILEEVSAVYREAGVNLLAWSLSQLAALEVSAGNWPAALPRAEEALEFAEEVGDTSVGFCHAVKSHVHAALGDEPAARAELAKARRTVKGLDGRHVERAEAFLELSLGNAAQAHVLLSSANRLRSNPSELAWSLPNQIDASIAVGELDRAAAELAELEALVEALDRPLLRACACRCRGRLADVSGDHDAAVAAFEDAFRWHDRVDQRFERARTLLALGVAHRRARHKRLARETLEEARRTFEHVGAKPWAAQARAELARIGGRAGSPTELTPSERRIADLVAEGKTNKEVAATLVVADRTVESALTQIYRKLDVRSRTELARKLTSP